MGHFKDLQITLMESPDPDDLELLKKLLAEELESYEDEDEEGDAVAD